MKKGGGLLESLPKRSKPRIFRRIRKSNFCLNVTLLLETQLVAAIESAYRRRWGWWLCDDQWNGTAEVSTMIEVSRSSLEAGNGKRGGNWKCDGRCGAGDRDGDPDIGVKVEIYGNYARVAFAFYVCGLTRYHEYQITITLYEASRIRERTRISVTNSKLLKLFLKLYLKTCDLEVCEIFYKI